MRLAGRCHVLFAFDLGQSVDLDRAEQRLTAGARRTRLRHKQRAPLGQGELAPPVRFVLDAPALAVAVDAATRTSGGVEIALYDFGATCIGWAIPFDAEPEVLVALSSALYDNAALIERSREIARDVLGMLGDTVDRPRLAAEVEDYVIFHVEDPATLALEETEAGRADLARILRAEPGRLSEEEVDDALAARIAYAPDEACFVDWHGALLVGAEVEDERQVIEFATVELLEMRFLDAVLARDIDVAYEGLGRARSAVRALSPRGRELARIARRQADAAVMHEGVDNALKLLGDDYLARLHRTAAERFHFDEWESAIERKLAVLDSIYQKLADLAASRRGEVLEWIIILLIFTEIVLSFTPLR